MPDKADSGALPPLDASLMILACKLELERDEKGAAWCFDHGVGGLRRHKLGLGPSPSPGNWRAVQRNQCGVLLHEICVRCALECPLAAK